MHPVHLGPKVIAAHRVLKDPRGLQDLTERMEPKALRELRGTRAPKEPKATRDTKGPREIVDFKDFKEFKALTDLLGIQVQLDHRVSPGCRVLQVQKDQLVPKVPRDRRQIQVLPVRQARAGQMGF